MKLFIDIGNTNTALFFVQNKKIIKKYFIHTDKKKVEQKPLKRLLGKYCESIDEIIIVSVVPRFLVVIKKTLHEICKSAKILVVGKNIVVPIKNKYNKPEEVGQDRLLVSYAAYERYGGPVLAIDFGTAVTFDYVNKSGEYLGGLIFPGIRLSLESLTKKTALLPKIDVKTPGALIGRDTHSSMNNGLVLGYASLCDGIIERFIDKYGKNVKIVATGGDAVLISKKSKFIKKINTNLVFEGLMLIANK